MNPKYIKAINEQDIESVRLFLSDEMLLDPRGRNFQRMRYCAESKIADLYEPDNGKNYSTDRTEWNEEFLYQVKNDLDLNFSRCRLDFYVEVAKYVLAEKAKHLNEKKLIIRKTTYGDPLPPDISEGESTMDMETIYKTMIVAGAITGLAGVIAAKMAVTVVGAAAAITGVYLQKKNK